jgi:fructose-1,6-bisphosphatase/inositol monophosphatase family enzyme
MAAGMLILREAGGRVTDFSGDTRDMPGQLVATNGLIHEELLGYLSTAN